MASRCFIRLGGVNKINILELFLFTHALKGEIKSRVKGSLHTAYQSILQNVCLHATEKKHWDV